MSDERTESSGRARLPPRQAELPSAGLGEVARDVVDHAQVIARDALAIGKLEARRAVGRALDRVKETAPRVGLGALAAVTALVGTVLLLIAIFVGLGDAIPSVAWRLAIFGIFFLVVAVIAAIFAGSREKHHESPPRRVFAEVEPLEELQPRPSIRGTALENRRSSH